MLTIEEIKYFMEQDKGSEKKRFAKKGADYYEGRHDIKDYRLFYYNADGVLMEDKTRSNVKLCHPFFTELTDQATQYILSGNEPFIRSDRPELQNDLNEYFNNNESFKAELEEFITDMQQKGFAYMYAYKNTGDSIAFQTADSLGVIEIRAKDTDDHCDYVIYHYIDRVERGRKVITRIQVWNQRETWFYVQDGNGDVIPDGSEEINPKPHTLYRQKDVTYYEEFGFIPFFRGDNNKKQKSSLYTTKDIIDDYDIMASSLSNNLIDFDKPIYIVKGFEGEDFTELQQNIKTKKMLGLNSDDNSGMDILTVNIPYEARKVKLELDEKNIYRFGMGLNMSGLKDTAATTNIAIKAAYSLLDLRCSKIETRLKQFLQKLVKLVLREINEKNKTDYQMKDVSIRFKHEIMSNAQENEQIELTKAQKQQVLVNTVLSLANVIDDGTIIQKICDVMDIDYEQIKGKLPVDESHDTELAQRVLDGIETE